MVVPDEQIIAAVKDRWVAVSVFRIVLNGINTREGAAVILRYGNDERCPPPDAHCIRITACIIRCRIEYGTGQITRAADVERGGGTGEEREGMVFCPCCTAVCRVAFVLAELIGTGEGTQCAVVLLIYDRFLQSGIGMRCVADGVLSGQAEPCFAVIVGCTEEHASDAGHMEVPVVINDGMRVERQENASGMHPVCQHDRVIVFKDVIRKVIGAENRLRPGLPIICGTDETHLAEYLRLSFDAVFAQIKQSHVAVAESEQRGAHVVFRGCIVRTEHKRLRPCFTVVRGTDGGDVGGGMVVPAVPDITGIGVQNGVVMAEKERAFAVARIVCAYTEVRDAAADFIHMDKVLSEKIFLTRCRICVIIISIIHDKKGSNAMTIQKQIPAYRDGGPIPGTRLTAYLADRGYPINAPCGGNGTCGKCCVTVVSGRLTVNGACLTVTEPTEVLACRCVLCGDACTLQFAAAEGSGLTEFNRPHADKTKASDRTDTFGFALDIGTTTLALALVSRGGALLNTTSRLNPQGVFGADVMSRIGAVMADETNLLKMQQLLCASVSEMITELTRGLPVPQTMSVAGNTMMLHIFCGVSPVGMGAYPFTPVFTEEKCVSGASLGLPVEDITVLPSAGAFIGADVTAGVWASCMTASAEPSVLIDIGTNGEMVLCCDGALYGTSTAAGPAMEGAGISSGVGGIPGAVCGVQTVSGGMLSLKTIGDLPPVGICGSGLIDLVAVLLDLGVIDETGYMEDDAYEYARTQDGRPLCLTAADIRAFQLAKSAIRAGMEALCDAAGIKCEALTAIYLAGGLGYYMNTASAVRVGLLPDVPRSRMKSIGNAALSGAVQRLCTKDTEPGMTLPQISESIRVTELNASPVFTEAFMEHMMFPCDEGD